MKQVFKYIFFLCFITYSCNLAAQKYLSGFIKDSISGERLIGATIFDIQAKNGSVTDKHGFFSLKTKDHTKVQVSFVGYTTKTLSLSLCSDSLLEIMLAPGNHLQGVEVLAPYQARFNTAVLSTQELMSIPSLTGKPDVLKSIQLLPGIRSQGEMSSVTLVRGGNPGENLYLIDQSPLIYVHHLGGFMSVFNPDMINDIEVYKASFPAKYGGRLSSIINISQKEGNKSALQASFSIGISDLSFTIEGPTKLKNSSFIVSGRKTLTDLYYLLISSLSSQSDASMLYGFHDLNAKYSWSPNQKNSLHFNFYQGDDYLSYWKKDRKALGGPEKFKKNNIWGNFLLSANWNHIVSSKLLFYSTLSFTHYRLQNTEKAILKDVTNMRKTRSGIQDLSLRSDGKYFFSDFWNFDFGLKASYLLFTPFSIQGSTISEPINEKINAFESAIYFDNTLRPWHCLNIQIGFRLVNYSRTDFVHFSLEPRASLNFLINDRHTLNISYMRVSQNAQLLYNIGNISANEFFIPSGKDIPISFSDQATIGWNGQFLKGMLGAEVNLYYKTLKNLTSYKAGFNYNTGDIYWQEKLETGGNGIAAGIEFILKKTKGKWTAFIAYSYSRSIRQFPNINHSNPFPFEYDSPNNLSLNFSYQISKKWTVNATWQFQSGLPYTPIIGRYTTMDVDEQGNYHPYEVLIYGDKNSDRMRDYHRLDIAFTYTSFTKKRNRKTEWTFGLSNVYNRQNPYYYYYNNSANAEIYDPRTWSEFSPLNLYQISLFPIMPMVSYKVWFGPGQEASIKQKKPKAPKEANKKMKDWLMFE